MRISKKTALLLIAVGMMCTGKLGTPAAAEDVTRAYSVSIAGFPVGTAQYDASINGNSYEIQGFMGSTGFFGAFLASRYSGAVAGQVRGDTVRPRVFRGRFEQHNRFAEVDIRYRGSRPESVVRRPEREAMPYDVALSSVRNALDPISALYVLLRDVPKSGLCRQNFGIFEGTRTSRIRLQKGEETDEQVICAGVYTRVGGFTPEQMAERVSFPFQLVYVPTEDGTYRVTQFTATTFWGLAKAVLKEG